MRVSALLILMLLIAPILPAQPEAEPDATLPDETTETDMPPVERAVLDEARAAVEDAADEVDARAEDEKDKQLVADWKAFLLRRIDEIQTQTAGEQAMLELLATNQRTRTYVAEGAGANLFDELAATVVVAHDGIEERLLDVLKNYYDDERIATLSVEASEAAKEVPLTGRFERAGGGALGAVTGGFTNIRERVRDASSPKDLVTGTVGGIGSTINPMASLAASVDNATAVLDAYPENVRRETQTFLESEEGNTLLSSVERFSQASVSYAEIGETLPTDLQTLLEQLADEQPAYQETIRTTNQLVATTGTTGQEFTELAKALDQVVVSVQDLMASMPEKEEDPDAPPARPFDITEYTAAVQELNVTLRETQDILNQTDAFIAERRVQTVLADVDEQVASTVNMATAEIDATVANIVDNIVRGVIYVLVVLFVLAVFFVAILYAVRWKYQRELSRVAATPEPEDAE